MKSSGHPSGRRSGRSRYLTSPVAVRFTFFRKLAKTTCREQKIRPRASPCSLPLHRRCEQREQSPSGYFFGFASGLAAAPGFAAPAAGFAAVAAPVAGLAPAVVAAVAGAAPSAVRAAPSSAV